MQNEIFTIGYSSFSTDEFIQILNKYGINVIVDVRSLPYSRYKQEFNRENIKDLLLKNNISYVFLGDNCGARIDAAECYINGKANYHLIARHPKFQEGINRICKGLEQDYNIALMCAEKDPITCHRTILICRNLRLKNIQIKHILQNGGIEDHSKSEKRLMKLFKLDQPAFFRTEEERLEEAYNLQAERIAYEGSNSNKGQNINEGVACVPS
ncbi:MAG: DUF488 domain-containing protein [Candidatus Margulisiibacteriota bacterium]